MVEVVDYGEFKFESLAETAEQLSALERATRVELLGVVRSLAVFDCDIANDGCRNVAAWLRMHNGFDQTEATEIANVAGATGYLPHVLSAFASGSLSWDKLVLICKFADPENDERFARECSAMSINQLKAMARRAEETSDEDAEEIHRKRFAKFSVTNNGKAGRLNAYGPIDMIKDMQNRIEAIGDTYGPDETGFYRSGNQLNFDALHELCGQDALETNKKVVITSGLDAIQGIGTADIDNSGLIADESLRRILCSASVELAIVEDGKTIGTGRATRLFPPKVLTAIMNRDKGCRFPGCDRMRWLHGHHVQEWDNCGHTNEDNGLILCNMHHRFVHEMHWEIRGSVYGALQFIRPDGRIFTGQPPPPNDLIRKTLELLLS